MDPGSQRLPLERVRRRTGDRLSKDRVLTGPVEPDDIRLWSRHVHGSPMYTRLAEVIASNEALMGVINQIEHTPRPNVLLAAVQYLLVSSPDEDLARFYPSLTSRPASLEDIKGPFTDFVLVNRETILEIGRLRYTQTNECRRCVVLLHAVMSAGLASFHLVDLGTSAGLNLALDRYHYVWDGVEWGSDSPVRLTTELRGAPPVLHEIEVLSRTGLDLHPVDPSDPDNRRWLAALIWPEQHERRARLESALELIGDVSIRFVAGDAAENLADVLSELPADEPAVVMNSFAMNQFPPDTRTGVEEAVVAARDHRSVFRVSLEHFTSDNEWANLKVDEGSGWREIGQAHPHGDWVEFYA